MSQIKVTEKGERLIASKFGIPYGLFLAFLHEYWWFTFVASAATGVLLATGHWELGLLIMAIILPLSYWSDRHFDV